MGNFNRGGDRGGRRDDRRGGGFGRRDQGRGFNRGGGDRQMHKAVCDSCHKECEVPFKPTSNKPIFCSDCFGKQGGGDRNQRPRFEGGGSVQPNRDHKELTQEIKSLNYKVDKLLEILAPTAAKEKPSKAKAAPKKVVKKATPKKTAPKKVAKKKVVKKPRP